MSRTSADDRSNQAVLPVLISTLPPLGIGSLGHDHEAASPIGRFRAEACPAAVSPTVYARFLPRHALFRACEETLTGTTKNAPQPGQQPHATRRAATHPRPAPVSPMPLAQGV